MEKVYFHNSLGNTIIVVLTHIMSVCRYVGTSRPPSSTGQEGELAYLEFLPSMCTVLKPPTCKGWGSWGVGGRGGRGCGMVTLVVTSVLPQTKIL